MTRLQKKCFVAVIGTHALLVIALLCSAFISTTPPPDNTEILTAIPLQAVDAALNSGVRHTQPPPSTPPVQPQIQPQIQPAAQPVQPPKPAPPVVRPEPTPPPDDRQPELTVPKPKPVHKIDISLTPITHQAVATADAAAQAEQEAREAAREARAAKAAQRAKLEAIRRALNNIKENATTATTVDLPGDSTVAYANYASIVKTVYTEAWNLPQDSSNDDDNVKAKITIAHDGRVIEAHIIGPSGDGSVDASVQRTLDRVTEIEPFPDGATEKERTYIINFNLKAKRNLG